MLKDTWKDLEDATPGVPDSGSDISVEPINEIAHAVIDVEKNKANASDVYQKKNIDDKLVDKANKNLSNVSNSDFKSKAKSAGVGEIIVDQSYNPKSTNAQSGYAVSVAVEGNYLQLAEELDTGEIIVEEARNAHSAGFAERAEFDSKDNLIYEHYATKEYVNGKIGDIETALDSIIAIQNELIGGDSI